MKAYVLEAINQLVYKEVPFPSCPSGWAIVQVKAASICSSDIPRIFQKGTYHFPTIPGHEFAGVVVNVADKINHALIGKRVSVFPLIPCKNCPQCAKGHYEMCNQYDYIGSRRDGGFAQYVAVPTWNLVEISDNISFIIAALMEPLAVSLHAVKKMAIQPGDTVAIIGTGMIAFSAAQWAISLGAASVTMIGRTNQKRKIADKIPGLIYTTLDQCNQEFDCVLEAVGNNDSIQSSIQLTKANGKLVLMGNPSGDISLLQNVYWKILRKQLTLLGTWNSSYEKDRPCDWTEVHFALERKIVNVEPLISHIFAQSDLTKALDLMRTHQEPYCKIVTQWNEEKTQ